ncbi:hypothetical protein B0A49_10894 [Cryomyces minteri]|uniref:PX domain-containing protein n=1 Tax=Cryomyces minteri TaxID=331657 RepID=A0A4U0WE72_9PEZI|nr:hypothetical protein B0A49_10894 [Cryomyces minteri]
MDDNCMKPPTIAVEEVEVENRTQTSMPSQCSSPNIDNLTETSEANSPWDNLNVNATSGSADRSRVHYTLYQHTMNLDDEGGSPWGDVPSRSHSDSNLKKTGDEDDTTAQGEEDTTPETKPAAQSSEDASSTTQPQDPPTLSAFTSTTHKSPAGRASRTPRRYGMQPSATRLEAVEDPLGHLGAAEPQPEQAPAPPRKEQTTQRNQPALRDASATASSQSSVRNLMQSVNLDEDVDQTSPRPRYAPPVQPSNSEVATRPRQTQPSMSVEQAAKPSFEIIVGDPHKVGDLTSSHTVYQVRTKTSSKAYRTPEFSVARRYRDFLWLYNQLHSNNLGVIIPPPPEKQAVGRFDTNFVESRRSALERMLNKTAAHPILQHDSDLKMFLESEAFNVDVKHKERKDPGLGESKGMFGSIGLSVGGGGKFVEHDDWFHDRRLYLDALETQLKALLKSTDTVVAQRRGLAAACSDFSASLSALSAVELSPTLSGPLEGLSDLQLRIRDLYDRQAQQDVLTLGVVIDEYIRLIGSVKLAFTQRQKAYHSWHAAESELAKRKSTQDKLLRQGRSQQDRLNQMNADVSDAERKVYASRLLFEDMGRSMRNELERFEKEKVEDFKSGVETFLESAVEAQKELIELWETFLMQLDAEEDGVPFGAPKMPAGVTAAPDPPSQPSDPKAGRQSESTEAGREGEDMAAAPSVSGTTAVEDE